MVSPLIAAIASLIIPGLGQALVGEVMRGIIIFVGIVVIVTVMLLSVVLAIAIPIVELIVAILAAYDAYKLADTGTGIV